VLTWTIGSGGLIGSAIVRHAARPFTAGPIPWPDAAVALTGLRGELGRFREQAFGGSWGIVWAAGAATTSTGEEDARREAELFASFARAVASASMPPGGGVVLCSSAGGVHAGSTHPPFADDTPPAPISPYGRARLAQEQAAAAIIGPSVPVVVARISNVYGPGQKLDKLQGLVSRLAISAITREPLNLFVPLSTVRDYIYVDDVAAAIHAWLGVVATSRPGARTRIIASGEGTSVGQLLRTAQDIAHRKVPVAMGTHPSSTMQAPDLRFVPSPLPGGLVLPATPLPVGMKRVFDDVRWRLQHADVG
jgi:UDP-glucose 4-epimerase